MKGEKSKKSKKIHDKIFILAEKIFSFSFLRHAYIKFFEEAILEEFKMLNIKGNKVLHIGCGALPNTLISLAKNIPAIYVGIDRDDEAVKIAKKVVEEYGLNIKIEKGDALNYPLNEFDFIIVSFGVEPKEEVFNRIKRDAKENVIIIYRKQWDFLDKIYGRKKFIPNGFKILAYCKRRDFIKSYLLTKD